MSLRFFERYIPRPLELLRGFIIQILRSPSISYCTFFCFRRYYSLRTRSNSGNWVDSLSSFCVPVSSSYSSSSSSSGGFWPRVSSSSYSVNRSFSGLLSLVFVSSSSKIFRSGLLSSGCAVKVSCSTISIFSTGTCSVFIRFFYDTGAVNTLHSKSLTTGSQASGSSIISSKSRTRFSQIRIATSKTLFGTLCEEICYCFFAKELRISRTYTFSRDWARVILNSWMKSLCSALTVRSKQRG